MPIMAAQGRSDARTAARILARAAINCIEHPDSAPKHVVTLNNVYRLLEAYRVNTFFGSEPNFGASSGSDALSLIQPLEQNVSAVRDVLADAVQTVFAGQTKAEAISEIETVLKKLAYPDQDAVTSPATREKTARFFAEVAERL
jgi:hypothetical protein